MFSFFKSKKSSPKNPVEDGSPIPAADDYIFIDRKKKDPRLVIGRGSGLYPLLNPIENMHPSNTNIAPQSPPPMHLISGIPFQLSSTIWKNTNAMEADRIWIDKILSRISELFESETIRYGYTLEKEIVKQ